MVKLSRRTLADLRGPWIRTVSTYGLAQLVLAIGAFARIPLLITDLGAAGYGTIVAISGLAIVVLAVADGLSQTTRVVLIDLGPGGRREAGDLQRQANTLGLLVVVAIALSAVVTYLSSAPLRSSILAGLLCVLGASLAIFGGPSKGVLESREQTASVNLMQTSTTIVGLPILILALYLSPTIEVAAAVTGVGLALPYLASTLLAVFRYWRPERLGGEPLGLFATFKDLCVSSRAKGIRQMVVWAWANSLNYAFDALIVALVVGTIAAADFGLASRIMTMAMLLSLALAPLVTARVARWRLVFSAFDFRKKLKDASLKLMAGSAVVVAVSLIIAEPLADWLSNGEITPQFSLFAWLGVFAVLSAATMPLMAAFAGRGGSAFRTGASVACAVLNVAISISLTGQLGPIGPVIGSVVGLCCLSTVLLIRARNRPDLLLLTHAEAAR